MFTVPCLPVFYARFFAFDLDLELRFEYGMKMRQLPIEFETFAVLVVDEVWQFSEPPRMNGEFMSSATTWHNEFERAFEELCLPECLDVDDGLITTDRTSDCLIGARPSQSSPIVRQYLTNARRLVAKLAYRRRLARQAEQTRQERIERFWGQVRALFAGSDKLPNGGVTLCDDLAPHMPSKPGSTERIAELRRRVETGIEEPLFAATFEMHERFSE